MGQKNKHSFLSDILNRLSNTPICLRGCLTVSHQSKSAQRYLRSHASIDYEKRYHQRHHVYIIHPFSLFRQWWNIFIIVLILYNMINFPYQAGFNMNRDNFSWTIQKNFLLFICCCDILVNFFTGYFDKAQNVVELEWKKIAMHYVKTRFVLDFIGSFPTDLMFIHCWEECIVIREIFSLLFVFRVCSCSNYFGGLIRDCESRHALYDFMSSLFWLLIILHWQACLYWIIPVLVKSRTIPQRPNNDSWINSINLWENDNNANKYGHCFLRAVVTFMHSGFLAQTEPKNEEDQYLVIAFYYIGVLIFCLLVARVMQFFKGANSSKLKYQAAIAHLSQYMNHKQLPRRMRKRLVDYYEFRFQRRFFREPEILSVLSAHMRQEIRMHSCRKLVENVTFFNNLPISLLSKIVALLKSEIFLVNDVIVKANQTGNCMYFIATGTVAIYTSSGKEVCHLTDGSHFGEIALIMPDSKRVASVVAIEICKLYKLERADFSRTIHPYPMLWNRIKKIAIERHEKTTILNKQ
ncbi:potassium/sodium hyperpolarization-activated cyclic nucleotide-gated channel 1-like [Trichogramma pretiosum]|uniref:potassium/sodium hyperpolarization-activated cyclic nucleotide-gated channel 1-like n=1 Tax=Trichogramma pretiosum TaxID=7493 RepID=UPI0006C97D59|nr:potassium/sodium hyperpolarization-activated cyclic nucleotide-gated channel 1-like [Trichogramma pretiosum]